MSVLLHTTGRVVNVKVLSFSCLHRKYTEVTFKLSRYVKITKFKIQLLKGERNYISKRTSYCLLVKNYVEAEPEIKSLTATTHDVKMSAVITVRSRFVPINLFIY